MKRAFDAAVAVCACVILAPLLGVIALSVWGGDSRPVLFRQRRIGMQRREFTLVKFRTMSVRAGAENGRFDAGSRDRVTGIGRFLRRTKLDELPQLWNVLRGDMSLVGPRPEVRRWVEAYPDRWAVVLQVRPGITDPASIQFRNEEEILAQSADPERTYRDEILPRKLGLYEAYVRSHTFLGDLRIIWQTLIAVVAR